MQNFTNLNRLEPSKRDVFERLKDFKEVYNIFENSEAQAQANRCVQCGDPYCHNACPLSNYIPQWLKTTSTKDMELSFKISNESSPFPEIMGRVCPQDRLCEGSCTLNDGYGAITIGSIETYITETGFENGLKPQFSTKFKDKKVAIIGSGPAGLSCATFLLRNGIQVDMFERENEAGGLLTYGIPSFKLDKNVVKRRVKLLQEAGLNIHLNCEIGKDKNFKELIDNFDAVFVGIGATKSNSSKMENEDSQSSFMAIDFLNNVQKKNFGFDYNKKYDVAGKRVVVIGGGDTAMDCVRTATREGASSVKCLYRRDEASMPGSAKEHKNAGEEGVEFVFQVSPNSINLNKDNTLKSVTLERTEIVDNKVKIIENSQYEEEADIIIFALGFSQENPSFIKENNIETNKWDEIVTNNFKTSNPKVFAGGDCVRGADLVVTAAYDGRETAKEILKLIDS
jgi:glutamate synthase (NADPH/NADH) small chain